MCLTIVRILTLAARTSPISPVCPACGIIKKSGKLSCCGRGGSWFGTCGSAGNANLVHTWYEGVWACKAQFQIAVGQQLRAFRAKSNGFSDDPEMVVYSKAIVLANTSSSRPGAKAITLPVDTPSTIATPKSMAYHAGARISKAATLSNTTNTYDHVDMSSSKSIISSANGLTVFPANEPISHSANGTAISPTNGSAVNLIRSASAGISTTPPSHKSAGMLIPARGCKKLPYPVTYISFVLLIVCW